VGAVIGQLLPLSVGVAISPVPIIAVILMLLAPKAGGTSTGFGIGWVAGIAVATVVFVLLAGAADLGSSDGPSAAASWIKIGLGVLLVLLAVRQWRARPGKGDEATLPKWMSAIDTITPVRATGLGFLLAALNPKNLALCAAAGITIGTGGLSGGQVTIAVAVFTVLAACTVAVPVVAYAVAADRLRHPLDDLRGWLVQNNAAVMGILLLVLGSVLVGKGIEGLG
jgi:threonine/homoserine/homoserine lactone efflux protein